MTIDEAIQALRTLRHPATDLERDLALTVVAHQVARSLAYDRSSPFENCGSEALYSVERQRISKAIGDGLDEHPEPQHLGTVSRRAPGAD